MSPGCKITIDRLKLTIIQKLIILLKVIIEVKYSVYNWKENEQLVLFVKENCWLFYNYCLADTKHIKGQ